MLPHASTPLLPLRRGQAAAKLQGEAFRRRCRARCPRGWRGLHEASAVRAPLPCAPRRDCIPPFSPSTHTLAHTDFRAAADDAAWHAPAGASVSYVERVRAPSSVLRTLLSGWDAWHASHGHAARISGAQRAQRHPVCRIPDLRFCRAPGDASPGFSASGLSGQCVPATGAGLQTGPFRFCALSQVFLTHNRVTSVPPPGFRPGVPPPGAFPPPGFPPGGGFPPPRPQ